MAFVKLNTYTASLSDIESLQDTTDGQRRGFDFVTLTNWASGNTSVPAIAVGSVLDINGALFELQSSDLTIGSVPGVATDDLYIKLTVSGGSTVSANWYTTAPTWDAAKGGWYDGTDKVLRFIVDFDGSTTWDNKREIIVRNSKVMYLRVDDEGIYVDGDILIDGEITPSNSPSSGTWTINNGSSLVIPRGTYFINDQGGTGAFNWIIEIYVSGSWRSSIRCEGTTGGGGGVIFSDGTNVRISNDTGSTRTAYYLKF
jgi:hypothetical protein